jgi:surface polysaccharide O-acyltransferase-like enzyme
VVPQGRSGRNYYLDMLRTYAAFAIVTAHVASWMGREMLPLTSVNWWVANVFSSVCRFAMPCFVLASGVLLLGSSKQESALVFYNKRAKRLLVPIVFWTIFYFGLRAVCGEMLTVKTILNDIWQQSIYYHLWYMYMIPGLYLLTPLLRRYIRYTTVRTRVYVIVGLFLFANIAALVNHIYRTDPVLRIDRHLVLFECVLYLPYYLCGYEFSRLDPKRLNIKYLVTAIILCVIFIAGGTGIYVKVFGTSRDSFVYHQLNWPVIVLSIAVFLAGYKYYQNTNPADKRIKKIQRLAAASLGIYLLHPVVLEGLRRIAVNGADNYHGGGGTDGVLALVGIPLVSGVTIFICYRISDFLIKIPYLRRIIS